jgi:glycosyltransferase involved in cell wall biosynthesis
MIVKNEEHTLGRCLESVAGVYDEIVIADTGSTDGTKDVAARFGAGPITLGLALPKKARRVQTDVRLISAGATLGTNDEVAESQEDSALDPSVNIVHIWLPEPPADGVTEAILAYEVPALLGTDARQVCL